MRRLQSYKVMDSGNSITDALNRNSLHCAQIQADYNIRVNDLGYYRKALEGLLARQNHVVCNMRGFMNEVSPDMVRVGLRHDVDHDIVTARAMSVLEREFGVSGSYYLLHSHPFVSPSYYAEYNENTGCILRNNCLAEIYSEMQANGGEIGLHVDPLRLYHSDINGLEGMLAELEWLKAQDLHINGIAAHNSAPVYGCENFEVFREYSFGYSEYAQANGHNVRLGELSAASLGITYEANYAKPLRDIPAVRRRDWLGTANNKDKEIHLFWYLHNNMYLEWGADVICWLYEEDCWAISEKGGAWKPRGTLADVLEVTGNAMGKRVLWHIHPFYLGKRI